MNRKIIGLSIIIIFAVVIVFGGIHYALEIIEASSASANPVEGEYVSRLDTGSSEDPALSALRSVCLFH